MQDTSQIAEVVSHEREIGIPTVEATQQEVPVSTNDNVWMIEWYMRCI